jgi:hypothetical protein
MVDKGRSVAALVSAKYCLGEKNLIGETSPKTPQKKEVSTIFSIRLSG